MRWKLWICSTNATSNHSTSRASTPRHITAPIPCALPKPPSSSSSPHSHSKSVDRSLPTTPSHTTTINYDVNKIDPRAITIEHVQFDHRKSLSRMQSTSVPTPGVAPTPIQSPPSTTVTSVSPSSSVTSPSESSSPLKSSKPASRFEAVAPLAPTIDYFKRRNSSLHNRRNSNGTTPVSHISSAVATTVNHRIHSNSNSNSVCKVESTLDHEYDDDIVSRKSITNSGHETPATVHYI